MSAERKTTDHDELRLLYQVTTSELAYFKTQQWSVTNYVLLLLAGIGGIAQLLRPLTTLDRALLLALALAASGGAIVVLKKLENSVHVRQARLAAARDALSETFNRAWGAAAKDVEYLHAIHFLYAVVAGGAALICWLVTLRL